MTLYQVAEELSHRLSSIFLRGEDGRRPRDLILFYEYFHGDNGAGLGANHQTGWTGIIARMMHLFATTTSEQLLALGKEATFTEVKQAPAVR